jgi:ATP-dependent Clp protease ATP-binding subunit ClpA/WD40 repeat protein
LDSDSLPPSEIIKIIDAHLRDLQEEGASNPSIAEYIKELNGIKEKAKNRIGSDNDPKAVIKSIRSFFEEKYQYGNNKSNTYENKIAPLIEEYGLWIGLLISRIARVLNREDSRKIISAVKEDKDSGALDKTFFFAGFRTMPVLAGILLYLFGVPEDIILAGIFFASFISNTRFVLDHEDGKPMIGASIMGCIIILGFVAALHFGIFPVILILPFLVHSLWNTFVPKAYKAICDTMYYRDQMTKAIEDEWAKRGRVPTDAEISDAVNKVKEATEEIEGTLKEVEEAIIEEIENDGEFSSELDDEAKHSLRELIIKSAGEYIENGGNNYEQWIQNLQEKLLSVFLEDGPEKITKLLQSEKAKGALRKIYNKADRDFLHRPLSQKDGGMFGRAMHELQHLLKIVHNRGHHHPPSGTILKSITFFIIGLGALLYYMLTDDCHGVYLAMAMGPILPIGGGSNGPETPKPEIMEAMTIDLTANIREKKVRDYYFSSDIAGQMDSIAGRGRTGRRDDTIKNNILLTGANSDLLESVMESVVGRMVKGNDEREYPNLSQSDYLLFNAGRLVDVLAIPGTIEDMIKGFASALDEYYEKVGRNAVLFINLQDLYDLGQMERKGAPSVAGLYMRLAPLLESKRVTLVGLATGALSKKLSSEERMMQYIEVVSLDEPRKYKMEDIVRDEIQRLNDSYKDRLNGVEIKIKKEERTKLTARIPKYSIMQEPPQVLRDKLETWFKDKFLRIERLEWEKRYHTEQIERLINEYKNASLRTELFNQYTTKWLERHLHELEKIKKEMDKYNKWIKGLRAEKKYWVTADELIPSEAEWEDKVPGMDESLNNQVIDQGQAVRSIDNVFRQAQAIQDKNRPIGAFIFIGPTGVGKTEVAKALSRHLFGKEDEIIRIDGSEHGREADLYKLIGPPPAILGHEQGGTLTNAVMQKPFSIVLFDELEKAYPEIQDIFLQIIDGARLTDGKGRVVNFQNTVIIMTSNLGYRGGNDGEQSSLKSIKEELLKNISKAADDEVGTELERLLEGYMRMNEDIGIFNKEVDDLKNLLEDNPIIKIGSVISFKAAREGIEGKKRVRREYLKEYIEGIIDMSLSENIEDPGILQGLFACLNYYEDSKPLTQDDTNGLIELLKRIGKKYEYYYRAMVFSAFAQGSSIEGEWIKQIKELREVNEKAIEEQKAYYLKRLQDEINTYLRKAIRSSFRQEFLNKLGENNIVIFNPLTKGALRRILALKLGELNKTLARDGFNEVSLSDDLEELVLKEGFSPDMGARPLIRALKRIVIEPIAEAKLRKELLPGRKINLMLEDGKVKIHQAEVEETVSENGALVKGLIKKLGEEKDIGINDAMYMIGLEKAGPKKAEETGKTIDYKIQLTVPSSEEDEILNIDNKKLDELEKVLKLQSEKLKQDIRKLDTQIRSTTDNSQQQLLQFQVNELKMFLTQAEDKLRLIQLKKQGKADDAKAILEEIKTQKQAKLKEEEKAVNAIFENLSIKASNNELEEQPTDMEVLYKIIEILKGQYRNDPFLIEPSFMVQRAIVEEAVRRIHRDKEIDNVRFIRLRLTKLTSYLSMIGAFEGKMRDILNIIHEDNLKKGIRTVVIMDLSEVEKEIERMRFNPFLLSFFLRLFHKHSDISFLMTTGDKSAKAEDGFSRYFSEVEHTGTDIDQLLESLMLCSQDWLKDAQSDNNALNNLITFEIKQRALKIWQQYYSGEPALETIRSWFKGVLETRKKEKGDAGHKQNEILQNILRRIENTKEDIDDEGETQWTMERLAGDRELIKLIDQLNFLDRDMRIGSPAIDIISKEELDREILKQERARIALKESGEIDIQSIDTNPEDRALALESVLGSKVFGQEGAIKKVSSAVKINTAGLRSRKQPIGSFLYGGPTGVGKTETAKQTAKAMGMRYLRIDMSEFKSKEDIWRLIGAPRGYIGWDSGEGTFIDWMRKYPRSIILFDEVEKGHPDILNILLQILEDGILTSNRGRQVDFSESIIFMTTNRGVKEEVTNPVTGKRETIFDMYPEMEEVYKEGNLEKIEEFNTKMAERVNESIKAFFRPELLNRLDGIEVFMPFKKEELTPIAKKLLKVRIEQLEETHGVKVDIGEDSLTPASKALVEAGFSPKSGAREIERVSKEWVTRAISPILKEIRNGGTDIRIEFKWQDGGMVFITESKEDANALSEKTAERAVDLLRYLQNLKGDRVTVKDLKELFYPMDVKAKGQGDNVPFTGNAKIKTVQEASPTKNDRSVDGIIDESVIMRLDDEKTRQSIIEWLKEAIGLSKRINLWRYMWEKDRKEVRGYWELDKRGIKQLFDEYNGEEGLGDKKIEVLFEKLSLRDEDEAISLGIRFNSSIGRELERLLIETRYISEDDIRQKLHTNKGLQGFAIAVFKLKQAGIAVGFGIQNDSTVFWIKIPAKIPAVKVRSDGSTFASGTEPHREVPIPEGCRISGCDEVGKKVIYKVKRLKDGYKNYIKRDGTLMSQQWCRDVENPTDTGGKIYFKVYLRGRDNVSVCNVMDQDGNYVSEQWFRDVRDLVGIGGKLYFRAENVAGNWNVIDQDGNPIRDKRSSSIVDLVGIGGKVYFKVILGRGDVYRWNVMDQDGNYISGQWFQDVKDLVDIGGKLYFRAKDVSDCWNIIKPDGNPISDQWFLDIGYPVDIGGKIYFKIKDRSRLLWNVMDQDGNYVSKQWFRDVEDLVDVGGKLYFRAKSVADCWNIIKPDGNPISDQWFLDIGYPVDIGGKIYFKVYSRGRDSVSVCNVMDQDGNYVSKQWFRDVEDLVDVGGKLYFGAKDVSGRWNIIKPDGNPISDQWFLDLEYMVCIDGNLYYAVQNRESKWNIINQDGRPVLDTWVDKIYPPLREGNGFTFSYLSDKRLYEFRISSSKEEIGEKVEEEIKDIARRLANIFGFYKNIYKAVDIGGGHEVSVGKIAKLCKTNKIPLKYVIEFLNEIGWRQVKDVLRKKDVSASSNWQEIYIELIKYFDTIAQNGLKSRPVPGEIIRPVMRKINLLLMLNPDGSYMARMKIMPNLRDIISRVPREKLEKETATSKVEINIEGESLYIHLNPDLNSKSGGFYIDVQNQSVNTGLESGSVYKFSGCEKYDFAKEGNPVVNVGISEDAKLYVVIIKDSLCDLVNCDTKFHEYSTAQGAELSYIVISESECNYRLTVDPEFRKLFSWSEKDKVRAEEDPAPSELDVSKAVPIATGQRGEVDEKVEITTVPIEDRDRKRMAFVPRKGRINELLTAVNAPAPMDVVTGVEPVVCTLTKSTFGPVQDTEAEFIDERGFEPSELTQTLKGHSGMVLSVQLSPDRKRIVSGSEDKTIKIWDLDNNTVQTLVEHNAWVWSVQFSPDGKKILSGSGDRTIKIWDLENNTVQTLRGHGGTVSSVQFSPDGKKIVSGSDDRTIKVWDIESNTVQTLTGHGEPVLSVQFSPDGKKIVSGSKDKTIKIWDLENNTIQTLTGHGEPVLSVQFSPDGKKIVSGSTDKTIKIWDMESNTVQTLKGHRGLVWSVQFSPDGKKIVSGSGDRNIKVWDIGSNAVRTLKGHSSWISSIDIGCDGTKMVSGSNDRVIKVWDIDIDLGTEISAACFGEMTPEEARPPSLVSEDDFGASGETREETTEQLSSPIDQRSPGYFPANLNDWREIVKIPGELGEEIGRIAVDPDTNKIYVPTGNRQTVAIINPDGSIEELDVGIYTKACRVTDEHIYVGTKNGVYVYRKRDNLLENSMGKDGIIAKCVDVNGVAVNSNGDVFVSSQASACVIKYESGKTNELSVGGCQLMVPKDITMNAKGEILVLHPRSVSIVDPDTMEPIYCVSGWLGLGALENTCSIFEDGNGYIYVTAWIAQKIEILARTDEEIEVKYKGTTPRRVKRLIRVGGLSCDMGKRPVYIIDERNGELIVACQDSQRERSFSIWAIPSRVSKLLSSSIPSAEQPDAYFGEVSQEEINPQIKKILDDPSEENYYFIRGKSDEEKEGKLLVSQYDKFLICNLLYHLTIDDYSVVVLRGVNFSGHYGKSRKRIYIPIEMLDALKDKDEELRYQIMLDFISHEFFHAKGMREEEIRRISEKYNPGIYEIARKIYREYIAGKLVEVVQGSEELKEKLENILKRVQEGKRIELTETQLHRLLWLIDKSKENNLVPEIAELLNLILEPNYTGNIGQVVMALEKEMLEIVNGRQSIVDRKIQEEKQKLLTVRRNVKGDLRFEGPSIPERVKEAVRYVDGTDVPEPANIEQAHYILINEYRARRYKDKIKEIEDKWNVKFITEIPKGVDEKDVIVLIDPEDADISSLTMKGVAMYLPLIYCEKSFILAAWLSINKPEDITKTPVFTFVLNFYKELLGVDIHMEEVKQWFSAPWLLRDKIIRMSENINLLRIVLGELDKHA